MGDRRALGDEAKALNYLAPNSTRAIDLTNPDADHWLQRKLADFLDGPEGMYVDGFFMDRGDEPDVPSTAEDIYADGRNGRQVHNDYPLLFQDAMSELMEERRLGSGFLIARPAYTGSQSMVMRWGGDTHSRNGVIIPERPDLLGASTDLGLRSVLISIQRAAFMGTPYWGSDIGGVLGMDRSRGVRPVDRGGRGQPADAVPRSGRRAMGSTTWSRT